MPQLDYETPKPRHSQRPHTTLRQWLCTAALIVAVPLTQLVAADAWWACTIGWLAMAAAGTLAWVVILS